MNNEQRPLRQEDYIALAEENKRLRMENEKLRKHKPAMIQRWRAWVRGRGIDWSAVKAALKIVGVIGGLGCLALVFFLLPPPRRSNPHNNPSPCYFVTQDKRYPEPWDTWYVEKWTEGFGDEFVMRNREYVKFNTKDEAWSFVMQWKLPVCK